MNDKLSKFITLRVILGIVIYKRSYSHRHFKVRDLFYQQRSQMNIQYIRNILCENLTIMFFCSYDYNVV